MTHYQLQLARIDKYPDRHRILIKTPKCLMFVVDEKTVYFHEYDETGRCIGATWNPVEK